MPTKFVSMMILMAAAMAIGCDDTRQADRRVQKDIAQSRILRGRGDADSLAQAQSLLDKASADADISPATRAHAKSMLAQAELAAANQAINDVDKGLIKGNRELARLMWEIEQLGTQVRASNLMVTMYRALEPADARKAAQQHIAAATGGAQPAPWFPHAKSPVPTLSDAKQESARLQGEITKIQEQIKTLQAQQIAAANEGEQAAQQSQNQKGTEALESFKRASGLRKKAADIANQVEVLTAKLEPLQRDLGIALSRQKIAEEAIASLTQIGGEIENGWKAIEQQILRQQQLATSIAQGGGTGNASTMSITDRATKLAAQTADVQKLYDTAEQNLTGAIKHYEEATKAAEDLRRDIKTSMDKPSTDPKTKAAMQALIDVYNPVNFRLGQADATLALAMLRTSRVESLAERQRLVQNLGPILKAAGLNLPKELDDAALDDNLKKLTATASDDLTGETGAEKMYLNVTEAPFATPLDQNAGRIGRIFALYGRAQLARATNDAQAAAFLQQAKEARTTATENKAAIPALPAELVAPAAPPAPPAPAPATTPAPKA